MGSDASADIFTCEDCGAEWTEESGEQCPKCGGDWVTDDDAEYFTDRTSAGVARKSW